MNSLTTFLLAASTAATLSFGAFAQDRPAAFELPEQCTADMAGMDHSAMASSPSVDDEAKTGDMMGMGDMDMASMPEHVRQNMQKMMETIPAMQEGMMIEDANVAFACGMIAHHQGAVDMAQVMLEHGDDEQLRTLAQTIIDAQKTEIEDMTQWLADNAS